MKISVRQICFIMLAYTVVGKLLIYPAMLCKTSGRDLLFSAAIDFLISGIVIWAVSYLCSRTDKTFFGLLENTFGNVVARIIYGVFALFFIACALFTVLEQKLYVQAIFYDTVPSFMAFLPFFFLSVYAGSKNFSTIGRCADFCFPLFIASLAVIFSMSFGEADFSNLLPVLKTPASGVFGGALTTFFRFTEPCWLLMMMGRFDYKKGDAAKITLSYTFGALLVLLFLALYVGVYGNIAVTRHFAISKTAVYFPAIEVIGRIDLLVLYVLEVVMLFAVLFDIQLAVQCVGGCTGFDKPMLWSLAVSTVIFALTIIFNNSFTSVTDFYSRWMWIALVIFAVIIPLCAWALKRRERS